MASKTNAECSLNTTECLLETIASILSEIQEQNNEYNWDPLTFMFTAIIGVIAIIVAGLAAFQAFLAAGPGRTKSGAYAIGPWSRLNRRKFDLAEMRFRTTSLTPILTIHSLDFRALEQQISNADRDSIKLRKRKDDYFPATWLSLLTHLSLDSTKLWSQVKLTGADFIPSELPAVPAYGSIRFVVTLAMILSRGYGRLTIDRESGLPRVRDRHFNLVFRQHPLLGAIGFFEMYREINEMYTPDSGWLIQMHTRLLQASGYMSIPGPQRSGDKTVTGRVPHFIMFEGYDFTRSFLIDVLRLCPHGNQNPKPACANVLHWTGSNDDYFQNGPLRLLIAPTPSSDHLPFFFPHKVARLRERLDTFLLQSRFWGMKATAYYDIMPNPTASTPNVGLQLTGIATLWVKSNVKPDIDELQVDTEVYKLCSTYLSLKYTQKTEYNVALPWQQRQLQRELETVDQWLEQIKPHILCRILTLSVIGDGIQQIIDTVQPQPVLEIPSGTHSSTMPHSLDGILLPGLDDKLYRFLEAINEAEISGHHLYSAGWGHQSNALRDLAYDTVRNLWATEELPPNHEDSWSQDELDEMYGIHREQKHKSHAWKHASATCHPLDNILIYRAVLLTMLYCLSSDSSDCIGENAWNVIVPIM